MQIVEDELLGVYKLDDRSVWSRIWRISRCAVREWSRVDFTLTLA
jgi:hypothetical protein